MVRVVMKNHSQKFGALIYQDTNGEYNVGDYIQSLAALGFKPKNYDVVYINRENAASYKDDKIKLIMNGWFTHTKTNDWIPSENIDPLFVSFHLNSSAITTVLSKEGKAYLKKHEPIGCRDYFTVETLEKHGIKAYFTGCLTLTLDRYKKNNIERNGIYIVDPFYNYPSIDFLRKIPKATFHYIRTGKIFEINKKNLHLNKIFTKSLLSNAKYISQSTNGKNVSEEQRFQCAEELLNTYSTAKLVITSRIHCALPCLAMGTPVIYINGFDNMIDSCRMNGILDLFNRIDVNSETGEFKANFEFNGAKIDENIKITNKSDYLILANNLKEICKDFIDKS